MTKKIETADYHFAPGLALITVNAVLKAIYRPEILQLITDAVAQEIHETLVTDKELLRLHTVDEEGCFEIKKAEFISEDQEND